MPNIHNSVIEQTFANYNTDIHINTDSFDTNDECFICFEKGGELHKVCNCNTLIHIHCQLNMINNVKSHALNCPVCMQNYTNTIGLQNTIHLTKVATNIIVFSSISLVCSAIGSMEIYLYFTIISDIKIFILILGILFISASISIFISIIIKNPNPKLFYTTSRAVILN